jgi:hypothetical protein
MARFIDPLANYTDKEVQVLSWLVQRGTEMAETGMTYPAMFDEVFDGSRVKFFAGGNSLQAMQLKKGYASVKKAKKVKKVK